MHYEDEDLPVLAAEIAKLPAMLDPVDEVAASVIDTANLAIPTPSNPSVLVPVLVPCNLHASGAQSVSLMITAEEKGFEPSDSLHRRRFSKPLP